MMTKLIFVDNTSKAQHARQAIRRLVGKAIGPHLRRWKLHGPTRLEIGPAEMAALRLPVERRWRRRAATPTHKWYVRAQLVTGQGKIWAELAGPNDIVQEEEAYQLVDQLMQPEVGWLVESIERHPASDPPAAPFTTRTLLQAASEALDFLPGRAAQAAQELYKAGLITHPHSASAAVPAEAQRAALKVILALYGQKYTFPAAPDTGETGVGQAIRPANIPLHPHLLRTGEFAASKLSGDARQLYGLIWRRFIASQMTPAGCQSISAAIRPTWTGCVEPWEEQGTYRHPFVFQARGRQIVFDGHLRISGSGESEGERLSALEKGAMLGLAQIAAGPCGAEAERCSMVELLQTLEETGIGRPETYAAIVESLLGLGYLREKKGQVTATRLGEDMLFVCLQHFPEVFTVDYAAALEESLDQVAAGKRDRRAVIDQVYARLLSPRGDEPPASGEMIFPELPKEMVS